MRDVFSVTGSYQHAPKYAHTLSDRDITYSKMISGTQQTLYVVFLFVAWLSLIASIALSSVANFGPEASGGIFINRLSELSFKYTVQIVPASWTFQIWAFIYTYQFIFLSYASANLCRRGKDGTRLFAVAPFIHWSVFVFYSLNTLNNISWTFLWDREYFYGSFIALAVSAFSDIMAAAVSVWGIYKYYPVLAANGFRLENRLVLGLCTSALGMYGAWLLVATHINLAVVLVYRVGLEQTAGSAVALALLMFLLALWFVLELGVFEKYLRFIYTPAIVFTLAFSGIINNSFDAGNPVMIFVAALLFTVLAMLVLKIVLAVVYEMTRPAFERVEMVTKPAPIMVTAAY